MKKTLAALAVLGAFAGSAFAANVTLYGIIDTGLDYSQTKVDGAKSTHKFEMGTGSHDASRFGLKGVEELGNGLKVGFVLENGFKSDTGSLGVDKTIFDREAQVYIEGAFGKLGAGRLGQLDSGNGSYALFGGAVAPYSTGWTNVPGHKYVMGATFGRYDNMLAYQTPTFAGFTGYAQYSFGKSADKTDDATAYVEGKSSTDRFAALGLKYANGPLNVSAVVSQINAKSDMDHDVDDPLAVSLGGAYDFGVAKLYASGQYFKDYTLAVGALNTAAIAKQLDGFGINVGVAIPVLAGTVKLDTGYMDAEASADNDKREMDRFTFGAGYEYPLSKRTLAYVGVGYYQDNYKNTTEKDAKFYGATCGISHKF